MTRRFNIIPSAASIPIASPGYTFGRSGSIPSDTWLTNEGVPSNKAGHVVKIQDGLIESISIANEDVSTFDVAIYWHEGNEVNLTLITTVSVVSSRTGQFFLDSVSVPEGKQLASKVSSGSAKNIVVDVIIKGTI